MKKFLVGTVKTVVKVTLGVAIVAGGIIAAEEINKRRG